MTLGLFPVTWILAVDGHEAHIWECHERGGALKKISDAVSHVKQPVKPHSDPHDHAEAVFATGVAESLTKALDAKRFERLILAAPPRTLGVMRQHITPRLKAVIAGEVDRELTKSDAKAVLEHVRQYLI